MGTSLTRKWLWSLSDSRSRPRSNEQTRVSTKPIARTLKQIPLFGGHYAHSVLSTQFPVFPSLWHLSFSFVPCRKQLCFHCNSWPSASISHSLFLMLFLSLLNSAQLIALPMPSVPTERPKETWSYVHTPGRNTQKYEYCPEIGYYVRPTSTVGLKLQIQ